MKKEAEDKLQFCIIRDLNYNGDRCYDFSHTILQKHVKDITTKWYKRYVDKFVIKFSTKTPQKGIVLHDDGKIYINHAKFDADLKPTYVYCLSTSSANSFCKYTKMFSNKIEPITPDFGVGLAG